MKLISLVSFTFFHVTTRKCKTTDVACTVFLLDSMALGFGLGNESPEAQVRSLHLHKEQPGTPQP